MKSEAEIPGTSVTVVCPKHNYIYEICDEYGASGQHTICVNPCEECIADAIEQGHNEA